MRLFFKDLVTGELFPMECNSTDSTVTLKYKFLTHQALSISVADVMMDFYKTDTHNGGNQMNEDDIVLFMYTLGA